MRQGRIPYQGLEALWDFGALFMLLFWLSAMLYSLYRTARYFVRKWQHNAKRRTK